jgi:polyhydroxyalkanoate synthesis regulator phasin
MGFLDKAKEKAQELAGQAKDKYEDVQAKRKADDLLDDLGRVLYLQRTGRPADNAEAEIVRLVAELQKLEAEGVDIVTKPAPVDGGPDVTPSGGTPLPPPSA